MGELDELGEMGASVAVSIGYVFDGGFEFDSNVTEYDCVLIVLANGHSFASPSVECFLNGERVRIDDSGVIATHANRWLPPFGGSEISHVASAAVVGAIVVAEGGFLLTNLKRCHISSEFGNFDIDLEGAEGDVSTNFHGLDVWEVDSSGRRVFIVDVEDSCIKFVESHTDEGRCEFKSIVDKFGKERVHDVGRAMALALRNVMADRVMKPDVARSSGIILKTDSIRFEVKTTSPTIRTEVQSRLQQLRQEFPEFAFEATFDM